MKFEQMLFECEEIEMLMITEKTGPVLTKMFGTEVLIWIGAKNSKYPGHNQIDVLRCQAEMDTIPLTPMEKYGLDYMLPIAIKIGEPLGAKKDFRSMMNRKCR